MRWLKNVLGFIENLGEIARRKVRDEAGICIAPIVIQIGIAIAVTAISYGIQALLARRPPPITGPQLDDLGQPTTSPGRPIPYACGRNIVGGQIIWSTGLIETEHTEKVSGGKGGGKSTTVKSYTYSTSVALAFNDGEICGVERILAGGSKVIWSNTMLTGLTSVEIDAQVQAKYDEVLAAETESLNALVGPNEEDLTQEEADNTAARRAQIEADKLREELEAKNKDVKPRYDSIEFFYGTEDQEPSTIIEGIEGVGNVSAFRGTAYVVIENLELADFGNFLPPISIDYATKGTVAGTNETESAGTIIVAPASGVADDKMVFDWERRQAYMTAFPASGREVQVWDLDTLEKVRSITTPLAGLNGAAFVIGIDETTGYILGNWWSFTTAVEDWVLDPATDTLITHKPSRNRDDTTPSLRSNVTSSDMAQIIRSPNLLYVYSFTRQFADTKVRAMTFPGLIFVEDFAGPNDLQYSPGAMVRCDGFKTYCVYSGFVGTPDYWEVHKWTIDDAGAITRTIFQIDAHAAITSFTLVSLGSHQTTALYDPTDDALIWSYQGTDAASGRYGWVKWSETAGIIWESSIAKDADGFSSDYILPSTRMILQNSILDRGDEWWWPTTGGAVSYASTAVIKLDLSDGSYVAEDYAVQFGVDVNYPVWDEVNRCFYYMDLQTAEPETQQQFRSWCTGGLCIDDPVSLTDVINAFMTRAGFAATEYEVAAELDAETIWGFNDNTGRASRNVLDDLARIRPVTVNEIEGKIRFRLADQATSATIPKEDVRAYDGQSSPPDWIAEVQTLEDLALPKTLRINYQDIDRSLNSSVAIFTREVTQSRTVEEFSVQAVDASEDMRNSVFTAMSVLLSSKRTFKISVPLKYAVLEPGDVVVIPVSETRTAKARIIRATLGANNIVELELALYIDTSLGIQHTDQFSRTETDTATGIIDTAVYLLDIPYLTDDAELDSNDAEDVGLYVGVGYRGSGFPGANLYYDTVKLATSSTFGTVTQATGDPTWELAGQFTTPIQAGQIAALPDPLATALVKDITSSLIVSFETYGPSFSSLSATQGLISQDNAFLVGNEIIQAETVELITTGTYRFSNLWRGRQGTEWAIGTQSIGDRVVHLDSAGLQRIDLGNPDLRGLSVDFRIVTVGDDLNATATTSLDYTYASRLPYAPAITKVVRDGDGNLSFELVRRNRYGATWNPGTSPFTSDPQSYEVDILDGGGSPQVLRTLTIADTDAVSYTAAQQITDFGSTQGAVLVRPYQLSALGFRGFTNDEVI